MGKYGNIDGIATMTNNPIATDNAKGTIGKINDIYVEPVWPEETVVTLDDIVEYCEEISHSTKG